MSNPPEIIGNKSYPSHFLSAHRQRCLDHCVIRRIFIENAPDGIEPMTFKECLIVRDETAEQYDGGTIFTGSECGIAIRAVTKFAQLDQEH